MEGGFLLGSDKQIAGYRGPFGDSGPRQFDKVQARFVLELAERAAASGNLELGIAEEGADLLVGAAVVAKPHEAAAWTLKRLPRVNDPAFQRRRWWLAGLVLSAMLGLGAIVSISIRLRQGVDTLRTGLGRLESDFIYRLPSTAGDLGKVAQAINRMADRRGALETTLRRQDRLAALGRVVAGVAHEIRNPLNSLMLTLELLDRRTRQGTASGQEVRQAIEEVDRLGQILDRLLAFGRPEFENRRVQDLQPLLERARRVIQDEAQRRNVEVAVADSTPGRLQANVDALAIEQVLINLLLNAIDASPGGTSVTVEAATEPQGIRIEVHDKGPGIPEAAREHIFDPYFTTKENGTGLGLAVSREIVCQHGGSLEFESNGSGTTFVLRLPAPLEST
jgi:signal transduction histidine kinase